MPVLDGPIRLESHVKVETTQLVGNREGPPLRNLIRQDEKAEAPVSFFANGPIKYHGQVMLLLNGSAHSPDGFFKPRNRNADLIPMESVQRYLVD